MSEVDLGAYCPHCGEVWRPAADRRRRGFEWPEPHTDPFSCVAHLREELAGLMRRIESKEEE